MEVLVYDGSFDGLLTAIFEVYEYKFQNASLRIDVAANTSIFGVNHHVVTDKTKADRVMQKLQQRLSPVSLKNFYKTFLSELAGIEDHLLGYVRYILSSSTPVEHNFGHRDVLTIQQISQKVHREKHRMEAFVRFQLTGDGLYYAIIQPDFNVLPLISDHFEKRYADQRWLIYDSLRKYGLYYDLQCVSEVKIDFTADMSSAASLAAIHDEKEELYQQLWQQYFSSVNIAARKNMKLHIRHMPKRYWRYLTEKKR